MLKKSLNTQQIFLIFLPVFMHFAVKNYSKFVQYSLVGINVLIDSHRILMKTGSLSHSINKSDFPKFHTQLFVWNLLLCIDYKKKSGFVSVVKYFSFNIQFYFFFPGPVLSHCLHNGLLLPPPFFLAHNSGMDMPGEWPAYQFYPPGFPMNYHMPRHFSPVNIGASVSNHYVPNNHYEPGSGRPTQRAKCI